MSEGAVPVSVAIPTFGRDEVLLDTIEQLLAQQPRAEEILVVDQTPAHGQEAEERLAAWHADGSIHWIRLAQPSQPGALNRAIVDATQPILLFLDDDIRIGPGFVGTHHAHYEDPHTWAVVGQVLQPGETELVGHAHIPSESPLADLTFPFRSASPATLANGMSGNMSVRRDKALLLGGFDENFVPPVSYRFDSDFCKRLVREGGRIRFEPRARIDHLRSPRGGTRSLGSHMMSASPLHGTGDYYFALRQGVSAETLAYVLRRPWREVRTRFHLRHPWWIPVKLIGELLAFLLALRLLAHGPRLLAARDRLDAAGPRRPTRHG